VVENIDGTMGFVQDDLPLTVMKAYLFHPMPLKAVTRFSSTSPSTQSQEMAALPSWTPALAPHLPGSKPPTFCDARGSGTYDDEMFGAHFIPGDGRVNEHDRLVEDLANVIQAAAINDNNTVLGPDYTIDTLGAQWNGGRLFQAARFITEMEYQHLVLLQSSTIGQHI